MSEVVILDRMEQGSPEWHALRKTKITATDSCVIMGASPWKTPFQLYNEKISNDPPAPPNERMRRGLELEPIARNLFCIQQEMEVHPKVVVRDWAMASLDGLNESCVLEIKCPGDRDHHTAMYGEVPHHYYPQIQHQLYVTGLDLAYYFSFDGTNGVIVIVYRDDEYIEQMVEKEKKFYHCLVNRTPPETIKNHYEERDDSSWKECASRWISVTKSIKELEQEEEELRNQLAFLSGGSNVKGSGISVSHISRKGNVDYSRIPELKKVNLDQYRKETSTTCRITLE